MTENPVVNEMTTLRFIGNIVPTSWFSHVKTEEGSTDLLAVLILADLCGWYRAEQVQDEETGDIVMWRSKLKHNKFQRSYRSWGKMFGVSRQTAWRSVATLKRLGLVTEELKKLPGSGVLSDNKSLFLEPVISVVKSISYNPNKVAILSAGVTGGVSQGVTGVSAGVTLPISLPSSSGLGVPASPEELAQPVKPSGLKPQKAEFVGKEKQTKPLEETDPEIAAFALAYKQSYNSEYTVAYGRDRKWATTLRGYLAPLNGTGKVELQQRLAVALAKHAQAKSSGRDFGLFPTRFNLFVSNWSDYVSPAQPGATSPAQPGNSDYVARKLKEWSYDGNGTK